ncbi:MAG: 50S ribosomal protein L1 [Opitutales bacterium]|nr:50S ribosomal protein L1 [Opitutales bacterium]
MVKRSKKYKASLANVKDAPVAIAEAVEALSKMPKAKFDETVQLSAKIQLDPKQANLSIRGTVRLPNGSGKKVRVLVFTENAKQALDAGADFAGLDDMIKKIEDGWLDFDVAVSTTSAMKSVRKAARVLGPRGLMPNPKSGTVTDDIETAVKEVKAGRVEYKMDKTGNICIVIGKRSFSNEKLVENAKAAYASLMSVRPETLKGKYIDTLTLSATMTPGLKLNPVMGE